MQCSAVFLTGASREGRALFTREARVDDQSNGGTCKARRWTAEAAAALASSREQPFDSWRAMQGGDTKPVGAQEGDALANGPITVASFEMMMSITCGGRRAAHAPHQRLRQRASAAGITRTN